MQSWADARCLGWRLGWKDHLEAGLMPSWVANLAPGSMVIYAGPRMPQRTLSGSMVLQHSGSFMMFMAHIATIGQKNPGHPWWPCWSMRGMSLLGPCQRQCPALLAIVMLSSGQSAAKVNDSTTGRVWVSGDHQRQHRSLRSGPTAGNLIPRNRRAVTPTLGKPFPTPHHGSERAGSAN